MSNMQDELSHTSRAMIVGAMIGGGVSVAGQWKARKDGEISSNEYVKTVAKDTLKAGAISESNHVCCGLKWQGSQYYQ